jgi:hypothetical protein
LGFFDARFRYFANRRTTFRGYTRRRSQVQHNGGDVSFFTMVALIVVTSILARSFVAVRKSGRAPDEAERLRLENQALRERVKRLESMVDETMLLEDLDGERALIAEIDRAARARGVDGSVTPYR